MSTTLLVPVLEAAFFTAGCSAIHAARRRPGIVTMVLALLLGLLLLALAVVLVPDADQDAPSDDVAWTSLTG